MSKYSNKLLSMFGNNITCWLRFNENLLDSGPNGMHGTATGTGTITYTDSWDGDQHAVLPGAAGIKLSSTLMDTHFNRQAYTIMGWYRVADWKVWRDTEVDHWLWMFNASTEEAPYNYIMANIYDNDSMVFPHAYEVKHYPPAPIKSEKTLNKVFTWFHVGLVVDLAAGTMKHFTDGVSPGSYGTPELLGGNFLEDQCNICARNDDGHISLTWRGNVKDFMILDRAATDSEMLAAARL